MEWREVVGAYVTDPKPMVRLRACRTYGASPQVTEGPRRHRAPGPLLLMRAVLGYRKPTLMTT